MPHNTSETDSSNREKDISSAVGALRETAEEDHRIKWMGGGGSFFNSSSSRPGDIDLAISIENIDSVNAGERFKQYQKLESALKAAGINLDLHLAVIDSRRALPDYFENEIVALGFSFNIFGSRPPYLKEENYRGMEG